MAPYGEGAATVTLGPPAPPVATVAGRSRRWVDGLALATFAVAALAVTARLWTGGVRNRQDQAFFEWMLAHGARVVTEGVNPFLSTQMNAPDGVNMMANTSVLGISVPLAPLTLAVGPQKTFTVFLTAALFATAAAWYLVLSRHLVRSRPAAFVAALFCAFAPGMISQANGHPNIAAQFLVPVIVWRTLCLREPGRAVRNGGLLAVPVIWQAFVNLEVLFMTAVGLGLFVLVMAVARPPVRRAWRPFLAGLAVTAAAALVVLAYPIWFHFAGPQAYQGLSDGVRAFGTDLAAYPAFARQSWAGDAATATRLSVNPAEENAFLGWPLLLVVALVVLMVRRATVLALTVVGLTFAAFSLGPQVKVDGEVTGLPSVWGLVTDLPLLDAVVPTRWSLAVIPVAGLLLAMGVREALTFADARPPAGAYAVRALVVAVLAAALAPLVPRPLPAEPLAEPPPFVSSGAWRVYTAGDRSVVFVPIASSAAPDPLRWAAATGNDLRFTQGYFLGPNGTDGKARFTAPPRPTTVYLGRMLVGRPLPVTPALRADAAADLRFWRAGAVVVVPNPQAARYVAALTELYGVAPRVEGGVWLWAF